MKLASKATDVEVFAKTGRIAYKACSGATSCLVDIPSGHGEVHVMTSSFWTLPAGATWAVLNTVNNDGYCNFNVTLSSVVCRAWATGIS